MASRLRRAAQVSASIRQNAVIHDVLLRTLKIVIPIALL